jgi:hypothetical protein
MVFMKRFYLDGYRQVMKSDWKYIGYKEGNKVEEYTTKFH